MCASLKKQTGQSLLELLVAMGIFVLVVASIMFVAMDAHLANRQGSERTKATLLAQEGTEATTSIKNRGWKYLSPGQHGLTSEPNQYWEFTGNTDTIDQYTRQVAVELVQRDQNGTIVPSGGTTDLDTKKVTARVNWSFQPNRPSEVALTSYLTNWRSLKWLQTTQAEFDQGIKNGVVSTGGGELTLVPAQSLFGNRFLVENTLGIGNMDSALMKTSLRFTAQATKNVSNLVVYLEQKVGASPTYRYGLQEDVTGSPSGVWLGPTNRGYGDSRATGTGWQTIALNETVSLEVGAVYHLIVQWQSGQIGTNRYISLRASSPLNNLVAYNNVPEPNSLVLWSGDGGSSWTNVSAQPIFRLGFTDGSAEGNPYDSSASANIFGGRFAGEFFVVQGNDKQVSDISFYVRKNTDASPNPIDDLYVVVEDATSGLVVEQGPLASRDTVTATYTWRTYAFSNPMTLVMSRRYRVYLTSPLSNNQRYYQIYNLTNPNQGAANAINYDGLNSLYTSSNNSGRNWTTTNNADIGGFRFTVLSGYASFGDFTSTPFDTQRDNTIHNYLAWTANLPANTTLRLQLRTASLPGDLSTASWFGPDGTDATYFSQSGEVIPDTPDTRWVQYKMYLTSDGTATPVLSDITVDYEQ